MPAEREARWAVREILGNAQDEGKLRLLRKSATEDLAEEIWKQIIERVNWHRVLVVTLQRHRVHMREVAADLAEGSVRLLAHHDFDTPEGKLPLCSWCLTEALIEMRSGEGLDD